MAYIIYCLIDPRNGLPYYVGSTRNKLTVRLANHIGHANSDKHVKYTYETPTKRRHDIVYELRQMGLKPIIKALFVTDIYSADYCERYCHDYLLKLGYKLFQSVDRFNYNTYKIAGWKK